MQPVKQGCFGLAIDQVTTNKCSVWRFFDGELQAIINSLDSMLKLALRLASSLGWPWASVCMSPLGQL